MSRRYDYNKTGSRQGLRDGKRRERLVMLLALASVGVVMLLVYLCLIK